MDLIAVNRYFGWYSQTGHLEQIHDLVIDEYTNWRTRFQKPIMVSEYGAGAVAGIHGVHTSIP
jgi:beta-glucuronidase